MWIVPAVIVLLAYATTFEESYRAGLQALATNRLADAKLNLEAAAAVEPARSRVWLALARTYWKLHESGKANEAADKAARLAGSDYQVYQLLALSYSESAQPLKACEMQVEFAKGNPDRAAHALECYLQARSPEHVLRAAAHAWQDRADVRVVVAKAALATREYGLADAEFAAAIRLNATEESYRFEYANSLLQRQRFEQAVPVLEAAVKTFDKSPQLALGLGVGYYGLRRFPDAASAFERTIALAPELEQPYLFLGKMLDQLPGRLTGLLPLFVAFEKAHPESYVGYLLHAKVLLLQSQPAADLLRKASALNPRLAEPHFELGVLAERARQFADAALEFQKAVELEPSDAATHYHLARVYDRLDKRDLAERERALHRRLMNAAPDAAK